MLEALVDAIDNLDITADAQSMTALHAAIDRLAAKASVALHDFDRSAEWAFARAPSLQAWLGVETRSSNRDANRHVDTARKLALLPAVRDAWLDGRLSTGQIDIIIHNITRKTLPVFAEQDAELVDVIAPLTIAETTVAMRRLAASAKAIADPDGSTNTDPGNGTNRLQLSKTMDGRYKLTADLDTETGEMLATALDLTDSRDLDEPAEQRRGNALRDVTEFFLDNHRDNDTVEPLAGQRRNRPHLCVIVNPDGAGETQDGTPIPASMVQRLMCDARINDVRFANGHILYYGRDRRTATDAQYNALVIRDRGCRFPGCGHPARWTRAHHVLEWDRDHGPTDIDNLVLLCGHHHRVLHKPGWHNTLLPGAIYTVTTPDGTTRTTRPPGDPQQQPKLFPHAA